MTSYLIFFNSLFKLKTWVLLYSINFVLLSLFIGTMTCFLNGPFMVMLILGFDLLSPLMILYIYLKSRESVLNFEDFFGRTSNFRYLSIWFTLVIICIVWIWCLEIFQNFIDLFREYCQNRWRKSFNTCWFIYTLIIFFFWYWWGLLLE